MVYRGEDNEATRFDNNEDEMTAVTGTPTHVRRAERQQEDDEES